MFVSLALGRAPGDLTGNPASVGQIDIPAFVVLSRGSALAGLIDNHTSGW